MQDVSGGAPVAVEGTDLPLWGMEVDPEQAKDELRASMAKDDGAGAKVLHREPSRCVRCKTDDRSHDCGNRRG